MRYVLSLVPLIMDDSFNTNNGTDVNRSNDKERGAEATVLQPLASGQLGPELHGFVGSHNKHYLRVASHLPCLRVSEYLLIMCLGEYR